MRRPSAPLVLSSAALFIALGGPAAAQQAGQRISGSRIANNSITGGKIRNGSLGAKDLSPASRRALKVPGDRSVTAPKLKAGAVGKAAIASGAVGAAELADGAVDTGAIATNAVTGEKIADGSLRGRDIARYQGQAQLDFPATGPGGCAALPVPLGDGANVADDVAIVTPPSNWPPAIQVTALLGPGDGRFSVLACNLTGAPQDPGPTNLRYAVLDL